MKEDKETSPEIIFGMKGDVKLIGKDQVLPKGAIRMTRDQVMDIQNAKIKKWQPASDVWPFRYGDATLGLATCLSGFVIHSYFRRRFRLGKKGFFNSYLISVAIPTILSPVIQWMAVLPELLSVTACPTCLEVRAGLIHSTLSTFYPTLPSVLLSIMYSKKYGTHLGRGEFHPGFRYAFKSTITSRNIFTALVLANFGVGYMMTHLKGRSLELIMSKEAEKYSKREILADEV